MHKTQKSATATENISDREKINIHQSISHQGCDMTIKHYTIINRNINQYKTICIIIGIGYQYKTLWY